MTRKSQSPNCKTTNFYYAMFRLVPHKLDFRTTLLLNSLKFHLACDMRIYLEQ